MRTPGRGLVRSPAAQQPPEISNPQPQLSLTDVAPTIAKLLGLRLDDGLDGRPLVGILRASQPLPPPGPKRIGVGSDGDIERTLRELGGGHDLGSDR